jgi:rod shape-determining protein MreC
MENLISRYRNATILVAVLFAQVMGLAVQVKRSTENESSRLIRIWAVSMVTPLERGIIWCQGGTASLWRNYVYLRGVRQENRDLKTEIELLRLQQVRLSEDAQQARRLQALLGFKEQFISKTVAAQVIGSSGSEQSRSVLIDKGWRAGIQPDMAVITPDGVVGKVLKVFDNSTSQVLLINDQTSGVGAILEKSRLQGVLRGTSAGEVVLERVMADELVAPEEKVLTSGGDQIFPKGLAVGSVTKVSRGPELFLNIRVRPSANLGRLEEVLVITKKEEREPTVTETAPTRAVDILAKRLPSVPDKPPEDASKQGAAVRGATPTSGTAAAKPREPETASPKPHGNLAVDKPAGRTEAAPKTTGAPAVVKPAVTHPPAAPAVKVLDKTTSPPAPKPRQEPAQSQSEPKPPEDKPQ